MSKYTTEQLKAALIGLYDMNTPGADLAFEMTLCEVQRRMGDEAFNAWCEAQGW
ncbi:hypothetical protein [Aeromonas sp. 30P]|uniref:hypothetical protein n=1 Tax=Aeromonas sp. 30P TaxID=3452717 RepID=UPI003F793101